MNLEESELYSNEIAKNNRQKKAVLLVIIVLAAVLVLLIAATIVVSQREANRFKVFYNGKELTNTSKLLYKDENGKYYASIELMANMEGYSFNPGEYRKYEEVKDSCNVAKGFEVTSLMADKNYYYKTIDKTLSEKYTIEIPGAKKVIPKDFVAVAANGSVETFESEKPVILVNDTLYASLDAIRDTFNVKVIQKDKSITFQSLSYVYNKVNQGLSKAGYSIMSGDFEDVRALVYDLVVVSNGTYFGVLSTETYKPVISIQYSELQFIQNSQEFLATALRENNRKTVGLISAKGEMIIKPTEYEEISVLSDKNGLYLVKSGTDYGVLDRKGDIVVYVEYSKIGLNNMSDFPLEDSTNASVIFEKFIPVVAPDDSGVDKYGLYNLEGEETLKPAYDSFGYVNKEKNSREINVLSIPASTGIKGLVINHNGFYGVYDMTTESLCIPCVFEKIYAQTKAGVTTYYMQEPGGYPVELELFVEQSGLRNVDEDGNPLVPETDNTQSFVSDGNTVTEVTPDVETEETEETNAPVIDLSPDEPEEVVEDVTEETDSQE